MQSEDRRYAIAGAEMGTENEVYVADLGDPIRPDVTVPWTRLLTGRKAYHTPIDVAGRTLYLSTDLEAPRRRVIALDLDQGAEAGPRTIVPESPDVIVDAAVAGDRLVVHYLEDVKSRLRLFALNGQVAGEVALPGIGAVGWPLNGRPSAPELFYSFASFLAPSTVYRCDLRTGTSRPFRPPRVPFDASAYETRQVFYTSKDGTRVPMFVTAAKSLKRDGANPTLLTGYGGYGAIRKADYEPDVPFWLELGGVYAVANLRGGGEYGEDWHRAGMLEHKQNSFASAAEYLISERFTAPGKLAIYGHSNGGLLVGASLTQRPDLFAAAVANAGHYDMLRYHRFTIGAGWIPEYGSPEDPAAFRYLRAYSPLHNVRPGACYPAVLLLAADHDDSVVPGHAYKFAAALQAAQSCDRPILLRVATDASHGYASRQAQIAERTDMWTFLASRLSVSAQPREGIGQRAVEKLRDYSEDEVDRDHVGLSAGEVKDDGEGHDHDETGRGQGRELRPDPEGRRQQEPEGRRELGGADEPQERLWQRSRPDELLGELGERQSELHETAHPERDREQDLLDPKSDAQSPARAFGWLRIGNAVHDVLPDLDSPAGWSRSGNRGRIRFSSARAAIRERAALLNSPLFPSGLPTLRKRVRARRLGYDSALAMNASSDAVSSLAFAPLLREARKGAYGPHAAS